MVERFTSTDPEHLKDLLTRAGKLIEAGTEQDLRLAGMCLADYYQAILRETGKVVGIAVGGDSILGMFAALRPGIGDLEIPHLERVQALRGNIYHEEDRVPVVKLLRFLLIESPKDRERLLEAATRFLRSRSAEKIAGEAPLRERLSGLTDELERLIPMVRPNERELLRVRAAMARRLMESASDKPIGEVGVTLLADFSMRIAEFRRTHGNLEAEQSAEVEEAEEYGEGEINTESWNQYHFPHVELICLACKTVFTFRTVVHPGYADFEDVDCPDCHVKIGHVRHDEGMMVELARRPYLGEGDVAITLDEGRPERPWSSITLTTSGQDDMRSSAKPPEDKSSRPKD